MQGLFQILTCLFLVSGSLAHAQEAPSGPNPLREFVKGDGVGGFENFYKFSVFLDASGKPTRLVYQNLNKFEFHRDYLLTQPEFKGLTPAQVDDFTYKNTPQRRALLGVLRTRAMDDGILWTRFNLLMDETPRFEDIVAIQKLIVKSQNEESALPGKTIDFEPSKSQLKDLGPMSAALAKAGIKVVEPPREKAIRTYTEGYNAGRIEWVGSQEELAQKIAAGKIGLDTILVTDQPLREFPPIAGLISATPLTPVSHAVLLAQMYEAPLMYHEDAARIFQPLSGHTLLLKTKLVDNESSYLASLAEYVVDPSQETLAKMAPFKANPTLSIQLDMKETKVRSASELGFESVSAYGGKASQMGLLLKDIPGNTVSRAAGIPISAFKNFMATAHASNGQILQDYVWERLAQIPKGKENTAEAAKILKEIRKEVKDAEIPAKIFEPIRKSLETMFPGDEVRLKLRSSSNVEDGAEFNGAGLYDSKGAFLKGGPPGDLAKTIKQVWASLYTDRGFAARRRFNVDETKAGMGILAHAPFKNEQANGVISLHFDKAFKYRDHALIVTQPGEDALVTHSGGEIPAEIVRISDGIMEVEQNYEGKTNTRTILRERHYQQLEVLMRKLSARYKEIEGKIDIEAEWKLVDDKVVLKQVRRIPQPRKVLLPDSSRYVLAPSREMVFQASRGTSTEAFSDLWQPRDVRIQMQGATEMEIKNGKVQVNSVTYVIEGNRYTAKNPKAYYRERKIHEFKYPELVIETPNVLNSSMKMVLPLPKSDKTGPAIPNSISIEADSESNSKMVILNGDLILQLYGYKPEPFDDDTIEGKDRFKLSTRGKQPVAVINEKVKRVGEGDGRRLKIGEAIVHGILERPLVIPHVAIGYGASHHDGFESYVYDLFADPKLTAQERKLLAEKGRYLLFDRSSDGDGNGGKVGLYKDNGEFLELGKNWTETKSTTLPKELKALIQATIQATPKACSQIYR